MIRRWDKSKPPLGPTALNLDSPLAVGLVAHWCSHPFGSGFGQFDTINGLEVTNGTFVPTMSVDPLGAPAVNFEQALSQNQVNTVASPVATMPLMVAARCVPDSSTQTVIYLGGSDEDDFVRIVLVSGKVRANIGQNTVGQANSITTASYVAGQLNSVGAIFASSVSRTAYLEGIAATADTTAISPATLDRIYIGAAIGAGPALFQFFTGMISDICIWNIANADTMVRYADPACYFELDYPLRSRKWISAGAAASGIKTINGLARASVKTYNGLAIASMKTWNGLA